MTEPAQPRVRDLALTAQVAFGARLLVALAAWNRFPPADDGIYYDKLAHRLADGLGYTWTWPDGTVTPVAHYPVGYPALLALAYRVFGDHVAAALVMHAVVGALGAVAVHAVCGWSGTRRAARWAGLAVALHPALLAYTPAVMTEGVSCALIALPFALALAGRESSSNIGRVFLGLGAGMLMGAAGLVRPQALVLVPLVAWLAGKGGPGRRGVAAGLVIAGACLAVLPWTVRNERAFGQPVLISANGGWNLLIGTDTEAHGGWRPLDVPVECREIWGEAAKDACFGDAARLRIEHRPGAWLALVPSKLAATFDYGGSGGSYLSRARPDLVPRWMVLVAGGIETAFERFCVLVGLVVVGFAPGKWRRLRRVVAGLSMLFLVLPSAWVAFLGLALLLLGTGRRRLEEEPSWAITLGVLGSTLVTHAVFFGASRYALVVQPWIAAMAFLVLPGLLPPRVLIPLRRLRARVLRGGAVALVLVGIAMPRVAFASPAAKLTYIRGAGAEKCPDEAALRAAVAARLGFDVFFPWAKRTVVAEINRPSHAFKARLIILGEDGRALGTRAIEATSDDCGEVMRALALAISIAVDDFGLDDVPPPEPQPKALTPPEPATPPEPPTLTPSPAPSPPPTGPWQPLSTWPREAPHPFAVSLAPLLSFGTAPSAAVGLRASIELRPRALDRRPVSSVAIEVRGDLPASGTALGGAFQTQILAAALVPCFRPRVLSDPDWLTFHGCALAMVGDFLESGVGIANPVHQSAPVVALGPRLGMEIPFWDVPPWNWKRLYVTADVEVPFILLRHAIYLDNQQVWQLPVVTVTVAIGMGVRF